MCVKISTAYFLFFFFFFTNFQLFIQGSQTQALNRSITSGGGGSIVDQNEMVVCMGLM